MSSFWPTEEQRYAAHCQHAYLRYAHDLAAFGRIPASLEVLVEEARQHKTDDLLSLIMRKRATLRP